MIAFIRTIGLQ